VAKLILGCKVELSHGVVGAIHEKNGVVTKAVFTAKLRDNLTRTDPMTGENRTLSGEQHDFAMKRGTPGTGRAFQVFEQVQAAVAAGGVRVWQEPVRVDAGCTFEGIDLETRIIRQNHVLPLLPVRLSF